MRRRCARLDALHDVCGARIVVDDVATCYQALQVVHQRWPHLREAFDDYIASPKENGYQSLHTVVRLPCGHTLEIQIRALRRKSGWRDREPRPLG
jgi:GTP pyrophosphokinase